MPEREDESAGPGPAELAERIRHEAARLSDVKGGRGPLPQRVEALVRECVDVYASIAALCETGRAAGDGALLDGVRTDALVPALRRALRSSFAELHTANGASLVLLELLLSYEAFERLRQDPRLGRSLARAALQQGALSLIRDAAN